jgi:hypothetical protein
MGQLRRTGWRASSVGRPALTEVKEDIDGTRFPTVARLCSGLQDFLQHESQLLKASCLFLGQLVVMYRGEGMAALERRVVRQLTRDSVVALSGSWTLKGACQRLQAHLASTPTLSGAHGFYGNQVLRAVQGEDLHTVLARVGGR